MSTPSVQPISNPVTTSVSWLQQHERLIIVTLILIFLSYVAYKGFDLASTYENHKVQVDTATLNAQKQQTNAQLAQAQATLTDYQNAFKQATQQNAALAATIASRNTALTNQQQEDTKLTPSELAQRWQTLIGNSGVSNTQGGYLLTDDAALDTMEQIEQVPVLKLNLTDETTKEQNDQKALAVANNLVTQGDGVVQGLQKELTDQQNTCKAQIAQANAQAIKGKAKWFGIGVIVGFVLGHVW
jgi:hypothetical protein